MGNKTDETVDAGTALRSVTVDTTFSRRFQALAREFVESKTFRKLRGACQPPISLMSVEAAFDLSASVSCDLPRHPSC
jgi:hypothetical protein